MQTLCVPLYLDVSWVFIGLISGCLQFLTDPGFDLVHISAELLQSLRLAQLGAFLNHLGFQAPPPRGQDTQLHLHLIFFTNNSTRIMLRDKKNNLSKTSLRRWKISGLA